MSTTNWIMRISLETCLADIIIDKLYQTTLESPQKRYTLLGVTD